MNPNAGHVTNSKVSNADEHFARFAEAFHMFTMDPKTFNKDVQASIVKGYTPDPKDWTSNAPFEITKGITLFNESVRRNGLIYFTNPNAASSFREREKKREEISQHIQFLGHLIYKSYRDHFLKFIPRDDGYLREHGNSMDKPLRMMDLLNCIHGPTVAKLKMDLSRLPIWSYHALTRV